jgi:hypothetical protein
MIRLFWLVYSLLQRLCVLHKITHLICNFLSNDNISGDKSVMTVLQNTQYAKSWHRSKANKMRYILQCFRPNIHVKSFLWIRKINCNWSWNKCRGMSMWDIYETTYRKDLWCVQVSDGVRTLDSNAHVQQRSECKLLVGKLLLRREEDGDGWKTLRWIWGK